MEPLSFADIKELLERRKRHAEKLQKRLTSVFEELLRIEIEIRKIEGKQEGPFRDPDNGWKREPSSDHPSSPSGPKDRKQEITEALEAADWNLTVTARALGIHRNTVANQMKRFDIQKPPGTRGRPPQSRSSEKETARPAAKSDDHSASILSVLAEAGEPLNKAEIIEQSEVKESEWDKTIKALIKSGDVIKIGERRWTRYERIQ